MTDFDPHDTFGARLRDELPYRPASAALRGKVHALLDAEPAHRDPVRAHPATAATAAIRRWKTFALAASAALAAVTAHDIWSHRANTAAPDSALTVALVSSHVHSLTPGNLTAVISTDRHTVKPWFDGKLEFTPPVYDFAADSFPLVGGRTDRVGANSAAVMVFMHGRHAINLYVWPSDSGNAAPAAANHNGYSVITWRRNRMRFAAVSSVTAKSLLQFASLYLARDSITSPSH